MERGESLELEAEEVVESKSPKLESTGGEDKEGVDKEDGVDLDKLIADLKVLSRRKTFSSTDDQ